MAKNSRNAYGFGQGGPLPALTPTPVISTRAAVASDINFEIGTHWINTSTDDVWVLTSIIAGNANWEPVGQDTAGAAPISKYIVDGDGSGDYNTIQEALDAANAIGIPATVIVRPGTYTENLTLYNNISIFGTGFTDCIINGIHIPPPSGTLQIHNCGLTSATHIFSSAVAGTTNITLSYCETNITTGYTFNLVNWTGALGVTQCGSIGGDDGFVNNTAGAPILIHSSRAGDGNVNTLIASGGAVTILASEVECPATFGGAATVSVDMGSRFLATVTTTGTATVSIINSTISTGATPAITHESMNALTLSDVTIDSSANPAIQGVGAGNINIGNITYEDNSVITTGLSVNYLRTTNRVSPYIVGPTGNYATIQAALDAASISGADQTVIVQPGTYTEELTLYDGVNIRGNIFSNTTISGTHTPPLSGNFTFQDLTLTSAIDILSSGAVGTAALTIEDCVINTTLGHTFNLLNWTGALGIFDSGDISTNNGVVNNTGGAPVRFVSSEVGAGSNLLLTATGIVTVENTKIVCSSQFEGAAVATISMGSRFEEVLFTAGTATVTVINSEFSTGIESAISHGSANPLNLSGVVINSSNATVILGAGVGVITLGSVTFENSSAIAGGLTLSNVPKLSSGGLAITEGTNAQMGIATLVAGTVTVATTAATLNSRIFLTHQNNIGTPGFVTVSTRVAATSFTITSSNAADISVIGWMIVEPN
jgi:hypothetical protein